MSLIEVILSNPTSQEEFPIFFTTTDNPPCLKWLKLLDREVEKGSEVEKHFLKNGKVHGRFVGFPGHQKGRQDLARLINECISIVNEYQEGLIPLHATDDADQDQLNRLHKYFEDLRGPRLAPTELFANGTDSLRTALEDYNLLIHEYESVNAAAEGSSSSLAHVDITFKKNWTRNPLGPNDYKYFDPAREFGGVYLHYCDVGKPLLDAYFDNDEYVGKGNIRPLQVMSADFDIFFGSTTKHVFDLDFKIKFNSWIKAMGLDPRDEKLSVGYLKLGSLVEDARIRYKSREEVIKMLSNFVNVSQVRVHGSI